MSGPAPEPAYDLTWGTDFDLRDDPPPAFVEQLRATYPTEAEVDHTLTRKMRRRGQGPYRRPSMPELARSLDALLTHELNGATFAVRDLHWFTGGVSKVQIGFTLERARPDGSTGSEHLVVRMDPAEGSNATSRAREFELLKLMDGVIPVPETFFLDAEGSYFPEPALIYAYADGVTKPRVATTGRISGLGTNFGPHYRELLAPQYLRHLAAVHTLDVTGREFSTLQVPEVGTTQSARLQVNHALRTWEEDRGEDNPLVDLAASWLQDHLPVLDVASVVHGDFRSGNFLFDEDSGRINAWLDWERGHIGDRHRDLAWSTMPGMGHYGDDGRYYVCGLVPLEEFYDRYTAASGLPVHPETLRFYGILNSVAILVSTMASNYRIARLGRSHQDILLSRVEGMAPVTSRALAGLLEEAGA